MHKKDKKVKWYLQPLGVVLLLFLVLGPLGLPLLYKSPKFSKRSKMMLTIAMIIYTVCLVFASVEIGKEVYRSIEEMQKMQGVFM